MHFVACRRACSRDVRRTSIIVDFERVLEKIKRKTLVFVRRGRWGGCATIAFYTATKLRRRNRFAPSPEWTYVTHTVSSIRLSGHVSYSSWSAVKRHPSVLRNTQQLGVESRLTTAVYAAEATRRFGLSGRDYRPHYRSDWPFDWRFFTRVHDVLPVVCSDNYYTRYIIYFTYIYINIFYLKYTYS